MARFILATPSLYAGDAVGIDVLGMATALETAGHEVHVCATNKPPGIGRAVTLARQIPKLCQSRDAVLILHHAIAWDEGLSYLEQARCRKVVKYHNVTPAEYFEPYDRATADLCRRGREQIVALAKANCDLYLADSSFNGQELIAAGASTDRCRTVAPFHRIESLFTMQADLDLLDWLGHDTVNLLSVGRIVPNKGYDLLLDAFAVYHHEINPASRLLLVGSSFDATERYTQELHRQIENLELTHAVVFAGGVTDQQLKSFYLGANVYVTTSRHEGFCVPLVEAMALKIPVVASSRAAIPETLGAAGIAWEESDPYLYAESVDRLVRDEPLRFQLANEGWERYRERFCNARIKESFLSSVESVL